MAGRSSSRKSVIDGDPSAHRSDGSSSSRRSKNPSEKRTTRSGTCSTQLTQAEGGRLDLGSEALGDLIPTVDRRCLDDLETLLGRHPFQISGTDDSLLAAHGANGISRISVHRRQAGVRGRTARR